MVPSFPMPIRRHASFCAGVQPYDAGLWGADARHQPQVRTAAFLLFCPIFQDMCKLLCRRSAEALHRRCTSKFQELDC